MISVRTKRPAYTGRRLSGRRDVRRRHSRSPRSTARSRKGFGTGGCLFAAHGRDAEDYDGPDGEVLNSGYGDHRFPGARSSSRRGTGLFTRLVAERLRRATSSGRATTRTPCVSITRSRTRTGSTPTTTGSTSAGSIWSRVAGFFGTDRSAHRSGPRFRRRRAPATSSAPTSRPTTSSSARRPNALRTRRALEFGADINGRIGLEAHDIIDSVRPGGQRGLERSTTSRSTTARRIDTGLLLPGRLAARRAACHARPAASACDYVSNVNEGGYFGDQSVDNGAFAGFAALTAGPLQAHDVHRAGLARLPRPDAVRPLLPRAERPRLHHRQSRSRAGDEPAVRPRRALRHRPRARRRPTAISTRSTT